MQSSLALREHAMIILGFAGMSSTSKWIPVYKWVHLYWSGLRILAEHLKTNSPVILHLDITSGVAANPPVNPSTDHTVSS